MKNIISLDEQLQLIAEKVTKICIGNPISDELPEFKFDEQKIKFPEYDRQIVTIS